MQLNIKPKSDRLFSVDFLKAISIAAVVSFHSIFVPESTYPSASYVMDVLFAPLRFCVPVFFTISFLLLKRGLDKHSSTPVFFLFKKRFIRLLIPTFFWISLATGLRFLGEANSTEPLFIPILQGRIFPGAYYLLVFLQFLPIFIWINHWFTQKINLLMAIFIQSIVFIFVYASIRKIFGVNILINLQLIARSFFVYWFVYMAVGAYFCNNWLKLREISGRISPKVKILLLLMMSLIMIAEYSGLRSVTNQHTSPFEYVMFSCILSVFVLFLCFGSIEEKHVPLPVKTAIQLLSKYSLGIFCINGILSLIFLQLGSQLFADSNFNLPEILTIKFVGWSLLLIISLTLSVLLDRLGLGACVR